MKPYPATIIAGFTLIVFSLWAWFSAENGSWTALLPVGFGGIFLILSNGIKNGNRKVLIALTAYSILVTLALYMPFQRAWEGGDNLATIRTLIMVGVCVVAVIAYIKSFPHFGREKKKGK
ncbi:MAG: hypothetical protein EA411_09235 [Saprospirales bacterium]|nr:MAG: hypothetical protein EA411_09235 [Saprospirales bacterium]